MGVRVFGFRVYGAPGGASLKIFRVEGSRGVNRVVVVLYGGFTKMGGPHCKPQSSIIDLKIPQQGTPNFGRPPDVFVNVEKRIM